MGSHYLIGTEFQFCKMKSILEMDDGSFTTMGVYLTLSNCFMYFNTIFFLSKQGNFLLCLCEHLHL